MQFAKLAMGGNADAIQVVIHTYYDNWAEERAIVISNAAGGPASVHAFFESLLK